MTEITLTVLFLILKLCGVISWSWWWIFSPIWVSLAITGIVLILFIVCGLIYIEIEKYRFRKNKDYKNK